LIQPTDADRWYHKAADRGIANAQYNLGAAYLDGEGLAEDVLVPYEIGGNVQNEVIRAAGGPGHGEIFKPR
jgi:TPR repeat protein